MKAFILIAVCDGDTRGKGPSQTPKFLFPSYSPLSPWLALTKVDSLGMKKRMKEIPMIEVSGYNLI